MRRKTGFTLIELVVVMTIIMVITAVGMVSFQGASAKSRDGRRKADLEKIRVALEMVRQVGNTYPDASAGEAIGLVPTYLQTWPTDPTTGWNYNYNRTTNYTYTLYARLEVGAGADITGVSCGTSLCNYSVINP